jgi:hypothetical protein
MTSSMVAVGRMVQVLPHASKASIYVNETGPSLWTARREKRVLEFVHEGF